MRSTGNQYLESFKQHKLRELKERLAEIQKNNIKDEDVLDDLFDDIFVLSEYKQFDNLLWQLINYVEKFDSRKGAYYRRIEEVAQEGY